MRNLQTLTMSCFLLAVATPCFSNAQGDRSSDNKACERAARIVSKGHPAKKEMGALDQLVLCGKLGADALVAGMPQYSTDTDTLVLESFFSTVDNWRDGAVMNAALGLAGNPGASVQARVFAVRYLVVLVDRNVTFRYGDISATPAVTTSPDDSMRVYARPCRAAHGDHVPDYSATPLPPNYVDVIRTAMASIASAATSPAPLRNAAACAQW